jgi:catechol 2,3-dioxygenase-like lactoylglutathione lyase family enzyme
MMAKVQGLGHVGLYVKDLERELWFYRDLLGLQVTDQGEERGFVFMSARPQEEHHELLLARDPEKASGMLQQLSFYCGSLAELKEFHRRFQANGIAFERVVTHGNAIGIYVHDPEGNTVEVYWHTGLDWPQPFGRPMDLTRPDEEILGALTTGLPAPAAAAAG